MQDIVALRVRLTNGEDRFFLTWGRVFDPLDGRELSEKVWNHIGTLRLGGVPESIELCDSLQCAASARYFFEGLFSFGQERIPFGPDYQEWAAAKRARIEEGKEIYYLGTHAPRPAH